MVHRVREVLGLQTERAVLRIALPALADLTAQVVARVELEAGMGRRQLQAAAPREPDGRRRVQVGALREVAVVTGVAARVGVDPLLARDPELRASIESDVSQTFRMAAGLLERTGSPNPQADAMLVSSAMMGLILERLARPEDRAVKRRVRKAVRRMVELVFPDEG